MTDDANIEVVLPIKAEGEVIGYYFRRPSKDNKFTAFTYYYPEKLKEAAKPYTPASFKTRDEIIGHYLNNHVGALVERFDTEKYSFIYSSTAGTSWTAYNLVQAYLTSRKVTFDANGGTTATEYMMIPYNAPYGELPTANRDYYTFDGWYTTPEDTADVQGEKVTAETLMTSLVDVTLYARWIDNIDSPWVLKSDMPTDGKEKGFCPTVEDKKMWSNSFF